MAPSNDPDDPVGATATYDTTTPVGSFLLGDTFYTSDFGFTSAACAIVAGVCAQILAANPSLTWRGGARADRAVLPEDRREPAAHTTSAGIAPTTASADSTFAPSTSRSKKNAASSV